MKITIAILEDNADRIAAMDTLLADTFPLFGRRFFRSSAEAIDWFQSHLPEAICISLDHDLERPEDNPEADDPGTGREVADFLARQTPCCPIIVHTTNVPAGVGMEYELEEAGWAVTRVTPYCDLAWLTEMWLPTVRRSIALAHTGGRPLTEPPSNRGV